MAKSELQQQPICVCMWTQWKSKMQEAKGRRSSSASSTATGATIFDMPDGLSNRNGVAVTAAAVGECCMWYVILKKWAATNRISMARFQVALIM